MSGYGSWNDDGQKGTLGSDARAWEVHKFELVIFKDEPGAEEEGRKGDVGRGKGAHVSGEGGGGDDKRLVVNKGGKGTLRSGVKVGEGVSECRENGHKNEVSERW